MPEAGRLHPPDSRRRAPASRRLAGGWPERSGGIRRADSAGAKRPRYLVIIWTTVHLAPDLGYQADVFPLKSPVWHTRQTFFHIATPPGRIMQKSRPSSKLATTGQKRTSLAAQHYTPETLGGQPRVRCQVRKAKAGGIFDLPLDSHYLSSEHQIFAPRPGRLFTLSVAPIIAARSRIPVRP